MPGANCSVGARLEEPVRDAPMGHMSATPLAECGLDVEFGFTAGSGREGSSVGMSKTQLGTACIEDPGAVVLPL